MTSTRLPHILLLLLILPLLWEHVVVPLSLHSVSVNTNDGAITGRTEQWGQGASGGEEPSTPTTVQPCQGFYSRIRKDRSGSQIRNMLWHSQYAYQTNRTYCGACGTTEHSLVHQRLLDTLGLSSALPLLGNDCPDDANFLSEELVHPNHKRVQSDVFGNWRRGMSAVVQAHVLGRSSSESEQGQGLPCKIVAHVRRGDLDPSTANNNYKKSKYLTNTYFLSLIEKYLKPGCHVLVHTEEAYATRSAMTQTASNEGNEAFCVRNYTVIVGGREEEAWRDFVDCDILIGSKSSFSMVPAMFSRGTVVFPDHYGVVMPDWVIAPAPITCRGTTSCPLDFSFSDKSEPDTRTNGTM